MLEPCASIEHSLAEIELGDEAIGESDTGVMKKKSSMVRPDLVCPASQTAPPDPFIQKPHYSSLKEGLEKLNDDQLERLVSVIGKDMRFKQELYDRLRTQEKVVENIEQEENSKLVMNANKCGDCGGILFAGWFRRRSANYTNCSKLCGRRLCGQCAKSLNEQLLCRQCLQIENLNYKQREWRILLWPLTSESFGWAKFSRLSKVLPASWTVRAKLELHLVHQLESSQKGCALDSAFIDFNVTDLILEASRQKMVVALMDFTNSGHFAHIDHAIEDVKQILQRRSNCIQACARKMNNHSYEEWNYFHLLSKAIISMLLESIFPSFSFQDPQGRRPLIQRRKPKYGLFSSFSEIDLSSSSHERSIINGNPHNYRLWPPGTLRNSRTSIHVNCIEDAHDFSDGASKYSVNSSSNSLSQPKSASPNNGGLVWRWKRVSQCRIDEEIPEGEMNTRKAPLKAASENDDNPVPSKSENGIREEDKGFISIAMEQKTVEAMAGQVVTIR